MSTTATDPPASPVRAALLDAARLELDEHGLSGISLRAVARRAGVSHAAPKHHFDSRAGLLTALATEGFAQLRAALLRVPADPGPAGRLAALGHQYVEFGLAEPALFELMFSGDQLDPDEQFHSARTAAFDVLADATASPGHADLPLIAWIYAHGLLTLTRHGALAAATYPGADPAVTARRLTDLFATTIMGRP